MRSLLVSTLLVCLSLPHVPALVSVSARGRTAVVAPAQAGKLKLKRRNPDGWFNMLIPTIMGKVERHADVDGGFYLTDEMEIDYDYWTYENTPNFLLDARGNYPKGPILACSMKAQRAHTLRTRIDGKRALVQECSELDAQRGFHYIYYVTFPKMKVSNGEETRNGMFNLTIRYKKRDYQSVAGRVVRSLAFKP